MSKVIHAIISNILIAVMISVMCISVDAACIQPVNATSSLSGAICQYSFVNKTLKINNNSNKIKADYDYLVKTDLTLSPGVIPFLDFSSSKTMLEIACYLAGAMDIGDMLAVSSEVRSGHITKAIYSYYYTDYAYVDETNSGPMVHATTTYTISRRKK